MRLAIFLLLLAGAVPAQADAFKCQTPSGQIVISDLPCDKGEIIEKIRPSESVSDPAAAQREVERQKGVADRTAAENEAARKRTGGIATLPDYSSPPPKWPEPTPVSPSWTVGR